MFLDYYLGTANSRPHHSIVHEAGVAYETAADIQSQDQYYGVLDAKNSLQSAADAYFHSDKAKSVQLRKDLINYFSSENANQVPRHRKRLAETYESIGDKESLMAAVEAYREAAGALQASSPMCVHRLFLVSPALTRNRLY